MLVLKGEQLFGTCRCKKGILRSISIGSDSLSLHPNLLLLPDDLAVKFSSRQTHIPALEYFGFRMLVFVDTGHRHDWLQPAFAHYVHMFEAGVF